VGRDDNVVFVQFNGADLTILDYLVLLTVSHYVFALECHHAAITCADYHNDEIIKLFSKRVGKHATNEVGICKLGNLSSVQAISGGNGFSLNFILVFK